MMGIIILAHLRQMLQTGHMLLCVPMAELHTPKVYSVRCRGCADWDIQGNVLWIGRSGQPE